MPDLEACIRVCIYEGLEVEVVLKHHQKSGKLTRGVVDRVLTNKAKHPRGKVRLKPESLDESVRKQILEVEKREIRETDLVGRCVHLYEDFDDPDLRPIEY